MGGIQSGLGCRAGMKQYSHETLQRFGKLDTPESAEMIKQILVGLAPEDDEYDGIKDVHALVVYVDYGWPIAKQTGWCPAAFGDKLDTPENAEMIKQILVKSGVTDITEMSNMNATREEVLAAIESVGGKCDKDDVFLFFYSGHGALAQDQDGDEDDGMDEALCLPDKAGNINEGTWLRDDDIAVAFQKLTAGNKMLVFDCCHSGTVCDFDKPFWEGQKAISICGCRDSQEAAAFGGGTRGGAFSKCIKAACEELAGTEVSVGKLFNTASSYKNKFVPPGHQQDLIISCAPGYDSNDMAWPATLPDAGGNVTKMLVD